MKQQEVKGYREYVWPAVVLAGIIAVACVAIFSDWPWKESPWTAVAAFGTVFAAVVALYIAGQAERNSLLEGKRRAGVVQHLFNTWVVRSITAAQSISNCLIKLAETPAGEPFDQKVILQLRISVGMIDAQWISQYLCEFHHLSDSDTSADFVSRAWSLHNMNPPGF